MIPKECKRLADLPASRRRKFFIYVLKCADASLYIGQAGNIHRRLQQHNSGEVSWTAPRRPLEIIHWEEFDSREAAVKRERDLKTGFGRKWLKREYAKGGLAVRQAGLASPKSDATRQAGVDFPKSKL
jgi:predicted GIY-YIG superfamily endonuclease